MNVKIRKWQLSDIDNLVRYANNKKISDNLADAFPFPYSKEFGLEFIERVSNEKPTKIFAITHENMAIGSIGIFPDQDIYRKNGAIAYWIAEPYWGKGIATSAIEQILRYGFEELELTRIYAKPFGTNIGSQRVLEKMGFALEATISKAVFKNNMYLDEKIYGKRKTTHNNV
ncbi:GNAT family N-acetyltransferase [Flagellimonas meridianipacifica]|uniref:RimJ/RimL family protein N-acetyltransferase n=1 Tax=Flagellimonas meridianipacifica TaxID=1080225 RepID=A0A2T0MAU1_9FLAO|nr:GNAT family protein [Allomuricauda pacifica]PRX54600.1 RimJ/RimL family protein N-acetyltransferase [Allomuricauda pacifica]